MLIRPEGENSRGRLIQEINPRCGQDALTDRWPADRRDQGRMIVDLREFVGKLGATETCC